MKVDAASLSRTSTVIQHRSVGVSVSAAELEEARGNPSTGGVS